MNLFETLKQFKHIEADRSYTEISKRAILARGELAAAWGFKRTILRVLETGVAVALTGFFILLITGSFPGSKIAPVQYSAIDPATLHAEAQAIDMQIQLAHVSYPGLAESAESTAQTPAASNVKGTGQAFVIAATSSATGTASSASEATSTATSTPTSTLTIDQALQELSN